jgi:hypothetical protein
MAGTPMTVVETKTFLDRPATCLSESERAELIAFIASNPEVGKIIPGTGGARKVRWAIHGRGKRGGARTIYYYHSEAIPLFLLDIYAKNEKTDLSEAEKRQLGRILAEITRQYIKRR